VLLLGGKHPNRVFCFDVYRHYRFPCVRATRAHHGAVPRLRWWKNPGTDCISSCGHSSACCQTSPAASSPTWLITSTEGFPRRALHSPEGHLPRYDTLSFSVIIPFSPTPFTLHLLFISCAVDPLIKCPMCDKTFDDTRTLACLHSFCLGCLETQQFTAKSKSSDLRCPQCSAPVTPPATGGVAAFTCNAFIDSLVKSARANEGDINRVIQC